MKKILKGIIIICLLVFIVGEAHLNAYALDDGNIQSFEEGVPYNWKCALGELDTSTKHYKHKDNSLLWNWKQGDTLEVTDEKNMANSGKKGGLIFWIYNEKAIDDYLTFNLGTTEQIQNNNPLYTFNCNLNFTGWRAVWVNLKSDALNKNFVGKKNWSIEEMQIKAPNNVEEGNVYFDLVEFVSSIYWCRSQDYQVTNQISSDEKGDIWQRNYYYINKKPYIDLPQSVSQEDTLSFDTIEKRLDDWLYGTAKYNNTSESLTRNKALKKYISSGINQYNSLNIERHEDGTITGVPLFGGSDPYLSTGKRFSRDVAEQIFLPLAFDYKMNKNSDSLTKIMNLFDYFNDQGWAEGSGLGSLNHETLRSTGYFISVYLMRDELQKTGRLERELGAINWYSTFGKLYVDPDVDYEATTSDELRTQSLNRLIYVLLMEDSPKKVQAMKSYVNWFNNALRINNNLADIIKPDYLGFHHQGVYMGAYAPQAYHLSSVIIYLLHDTAFKISTTAQYNLKQALITHDLLTHQTEVPIFIRGRIVNSKEIGTEILPSHAYMALSGNPETGETVDKDMAGIFKKNWNISHNSLISQAGIDISYVNTLGAIDNMLDIINTDIPAAKEQEGFWSKPYGGLAIKKQDNWMAMIKGFSKYVWDYESDSSANIYGRYLSYGTLQIFSQGNPINDKANGYDYDHGWDWNRMPGATTKHLDLDSLRNVSSNNYSDQTFLGSVQGNDGKGVWGMSLHDYTYDNTFTAKKSAFFNGNEIIMLGSDINNSDTLNNTETTLFQSSLNGNKSLPINVNGQEVSEYPYSQLLKGKHLWMIDPYGNGYYIRKTNNLHIERNTQYSKNQTGKGNTTGEYTTAWFDHGTSPNNQGYEYVIKVKTNQEEMQKFASKLDYKVFQKDNVAHIVKMMGSNTIGYVIFEANKPLYNNECILSTDAPIVAMTQRSKYSLDIAISDPDLRVSNTNNMVSSTMKNVRVEIKGKWKLRKESENARIIEVKDNSTVLEFSCQDGKTVNTTLDILKR